MIDILQALPYYRQAVHTGGPAILVHRLNKALTYSANVKVVTSNGDLEKDINLPCFTNELEIDEEGIPTVYLNRSQHFLPPTYYYTPKLSIWLKTQLINYDVVIIHGIWTYFSKVIPGACQKFGKPFLFFFHGSLDPWAFRYHGVKKLPYWYLIEKNNVEQAAGIITLNQYEANQARLMNIKQPIFIARNGLLFPLTKIPNPEEIIDQAFPEWSGSHIVLFMSRLHPKKGLDILLQSWKKITRKFPDWHLVIAGPDENNYLRILNQIVENFFIEKSVHFLGVVSGEIKTALLQKASVFVLPSYSEGVPTAVIEAMGYGIPVLITPGCHLPEVAEYKAGVIVNTNPMDIADGLECLMSDTVLRQKLGKNAQQLAQLEFDEMKVADGLITFCKEILNNKES